MMSPLCSHLILNGAITFYGGYLHQHTTREFRGIMPSLMEDCGLSQTRICSIYPHQSTSINMIRTDQHHSFEYQIVQSYIQNGIISYFHNLEPISVDYVHDVLHAKFTHQYTP